VIALDTDGSKRLLRSTKLIHEVNPLSGLIFNPDECLQDLLRYGRQLKERFGRRPLLLPTEDSGLRFCADSLTHIKECFVLLGDPKEMDVARLCDKGRFFSIFKGDESYVPWTQAYVKEEQMRPVLSEIPYPVVLKPARKDLRQSFLQRFGVKIVVARSAAALRDILGSYFPTDGLVIQELIDHREGEEVSWWGYRARDGRSLGMTVRQLRKHPSMGGTATAVRTEDIRELHSLAEEILERADFWGLCELEFIPKGGGYKLVECNPRPWLQIGLALRAGLNFPLLAYQEIEGLSMPGINASSGATAAQNLRWLSPEYDLIRCFSAGRKGLLKNVRTWCRDLRHAEETGIWDMNEPLVVLERLFSYPGKVWKNRSRTRAR
jgi:predicted ATP-grasp superfamily ATP-dependent carboligase